jgi:phosphocarrier protein HPr
MRKAAVEAFVEVHSRWGLNGRGSARLAFTASQFHSDIVVSANGRSVNGKDVMSVMSLRAKAGVTVRVLACGPDEHAATQALIAVIASSEVS